MKQLRLAFRSLWYGSHLTLAVRHGSCGSVTSTGRSWAEAESKLRFKVFNRGLSADWSTLRCEDQNKDAWHHVMEWRWRRLATPELDPRRLP